MLALSLEGEDDMGDWWLSTATAPTDLHSRRFPLPNEVIHLGPSINGQPVHVGAFLCMHGHDASICTAMHRVAPSQSYYTAVSTVSPHSSIIASCKYYCIL